MIGDKLIDLECGWNAGVKKSILVRTGYGAELERTEPDKLTRAVVVDDLNGAADWILKVGLALRSSGRSGAHGVTRPSQ